MKSVIRFTKLLVCIALLNLVACNAQEEQNRLPAVSHTSKLFSPVGMGFVPRTEGSARVGEDYVIDIKLTSLLDVDRLRVTLSVKGALALQNTETDMLFTQQTAGQVNRLVVTVNPQAEGLFYVYLSATAEQGEMRHNGNFAIPVYVGDQAREARPAAVGIIREDTTGEKVIHLPATESTD